MNAAWGLRQIALIPNGAILSVDQTGHFKQWLLNTTNEQLANLSGVYTDDHLIILGEKDALPWLPGCTYIGRDHQAQSLYIPTYAIPPYSIDLVERSIINRYGEGIYAIDLKHKCIIPLTCARPLHRETLLNAMS